MRLVTWSIVSVLPLLLGGYAHFNNWKTQLTHSAAQVETAPLPPAVCNSQNFILTERKANVPGYIPHFVPSANKMFEDSPYEKATPELSTNINVNASNVLIVDPPGSGGPNSFNNWNQMLSNNKDVYLLKPGDYTSLGVFKPNMSGTYYKRKVLRAYYPAGKCTIEGYGTLAPLDDIHPYQLKETSCEVVIEGFFLNSRSYWTIGNLTVRGSHDYEYSTYKCDPTAYYFISGGPGSVMFQANYNVIHKCLFEESIKGGYLRMFNCNYNTIQKSVFNDKFTERGQDFGGIVLEAGIGKVSRCNAIVSNEFINIDGIGLNFQHPCEKPGNDPFLSTGTVDGTVIANNDIYMKGEYHPCQINGKWLEECACSEDGLDIKNGSSCPSEPVMIVGNRIWGYRGTDQCCGGTGGSGPGILIHKNAQNVVVKDNIIFNCASGITIESGNVYDNCNQPNNKGVVENIVVTNNFITEMAEELVDKNSEISGVALISRAHKVSVYYNTFRDVDRFLNLREDLGEDEPISNHFQCNTFLRGAKSCHFYPFLASCPPNPADTDSRSGLNAWYDFPGLQYIYQVNLPLSTNTYSPALSASNLSCYTVYLKRWTGAEEKTFSFAVPTKYGSYVNGPTVNTLSNCDCKSKLLYPDGWDIEKWVDIPLPTETCANSCTNFGGSGAGVGDSAAEGHVLQAVAYPNPNNGRFLLQLDGLPAGEPVVIRIFNVEGEFLGRVDAGEAPELDLSDYPNGMYLLVVEADGQTARTRVVLQR